MRAGSGLFLTFWKSLGGSPGKQDVFKKTRCCSKSSGKIVNMCLIVKQRNIQSIGTKNLDIACLVKCLKPHVSSQKLFHRIGYFETIFPVD